MKGSKLAVFLATAALAVAPAATNAEPAAPPGAIAAKSCSGSYTHAVVPGGAHKCLRAGQFCSRRRSYQRVYHRKGFTCRSNRHLGYY